MECASFAQYLGLDNALFAELTTAIAIEQATSKGYTSLRDMWLNYLLLTSNKKFFAIYIYIYREENVCADMLINFGLTLSFSLVL